MKCEKKNGLDDLSMDVIEGLCSPHLKDVTIDMAEMTLDVILKNEALRSIPVVKTLLSIIETTQNVSNYLFLKKIVAFLSNIKKVSAKKRKDMINKIDNSGEYKTKVGETLLNLLDKSDSTEKAAYLGTWFTAFLKGKISYGMFLNGAHVIERVYLLDLEYFIKSDEDWLMVEDAYEEIAAGLFYIDFTTAFWDIRDVAAGIEDPDNIGDAGAKITPVGMAIRSVFNKYYTPPKYYGDPMLDGLFRRYKASRSNEN